MAKGETAWEICNEIYAIPFWLLASYNPGKDINSIPVGESVVVPIISPVKSTKKSPPDFFTIFVCDYTTAFIVDNTLMHDPRPRGEHVHEWP